MGQTDGRTPYRYTEPADTMTAVSVSELTRHGEHPLTVLEKMCATTQKSRFWILKKNVKKSLKTYVVLAATQSIRHK